MIRGATQSSTEQGDRTSLGQELLAWLRHSSLTHACLLGGAIVVCYFGLWNAYFITDDYWMLGWVRHHTSLASAVLAQFGYGVRFLLDAVMWTRVQLFDLNAAPYYWVSLAQHLAVGLMVYWLVLFWTRRRGTAFLAALLFGTTFAHYEVVTWITGSEYSLGALLYLSTLAFFALYLQRRALRWYAAALLTFILLLLYLEMALSLPVILIAYHLMMGRDRWRGLIDWRELRIHFPFWILFAIYLAVQFGFVSSGSSEAVVAGAAYRPGLHILPNFLYLVYLFVPDVHYGVLSAAIGQTGVTIAHLMTAASAFGATALAVYVFLKGSPLVRFGLALIYVPFLPYTLWDGGFAGAIRYRYLPSVGLALLMALLLTHLHARWRARSWSARRLLVPAFVAAALAVNVVVIQIWVRRHVENSVLRQAFVSQLAHRYANIESGAQVYIEVPDAKYKDLKEACTLLFDRPLDCRAFLYGEVSPATVSGASQAGRLFWLRATPNGIEQVFPTQSGSP